MCVCVCVIYIGIVVTRRLFAISNIRNIADFVGNVVEYIYVYIRLCKRTLFLSKFKIFIKKRRKRKRNGRNVKNYMRKLEEHIHAFSYADIAYMWVYMSARESLALTVR